MGRFSLDIPVRFSDEDRLAHVNNAVYLSYLEEARAAYLRGLRNDLALEGAQLILARVEIDFLAPAHFGETVRVAVWVERVGTRSFSLAYALTVGDRPVARATTVLVWYDYEKGASRAIPEEARALLEGAVAE